MVVLTAVLMTLMVDREAPTALADIHGHVVGIGLVAAGPRKAWCQTQNLVVLRTQWVLLLPAVHARVDYRHLVLGVEQHVLTALICRVDELERESTGRHDRNVSQVAVPVLVGLKVTLVDTGL